MTDPQQTVQIPTALLMTRLRQAVPDLIAAYAFGSRTTGQANSHSDLDLAVLAEGCIEPVSLWGIANELAMTCGHEVDLVDLRRASTVLQNQVLRANCRLWARDIKADLFECYVLSAKTALDEARAPLLADIAERGHIYG